MDEVLNVYRAKLYVREIKVERLFEKSRPILVNKGEMVQVFSNVIANSIEAMPKGDPKKVALRRFIGSESVQLTLDKAGRIVLPDNLARSADIQDQALFVGCIEHFEIWSPTRYDNAKAADVEVATEAFSLMD